MAQNTATMSLGVRVAWWVKPYLQTLLFVAWMTGMDVNEERVMKTALRGMRFFIVR